MKKLLRASLKNLAGTAGAIALLPFLGNAAAAQSLSRTVGLTTEDIGVLDRSRPDYDAKGMPFDAWRLFPRLDVGFAYDSNVFRTAANLDDTYLTVAPSLKLVTQWGTSALEVFGGSNSYFYNKFNSENLSDWDVGADTRLRDLLPGAELYIGGTVNKLHEQRSSPNTIGSQDGPTEYNLYNLQASGSYQRGLLGVSAGVEYDRYNFDSVGLIGGGILSNSDRNMGEFQAWAKANYDFSPDFHIYIKPSYDVRDYDQYLDRAGLHRSSSGERVDLGLQVQLTHLLAGSVEIGYLHQNFIGPLKDADGLAYNINLDWFATPLLTVHLTGNRQLQQSTIYLVSVNDDRNVKLSADYELLRELILQAHIQFTEDRFTSTVRLDHGDDIGLSGKYLLNRYMSLNLGYDYSQRFSNVANATFSDHTILLGLDLHV